MKINLPEDFLISGINCGIKKGKKDLGLIYCPKGFICSAAFTTNLLRTDSIIVSEEHLRKNKIIKSIIANSGCANTASGPNGYKITKEICSYLSKKLGILKEQVLIASTGVIGVELPKQKCFSGIDKLSEKVKTKTKEYLNFAEAIMTTDTKPKIFSDRISLNGKKVTTVCFAKGAGMIGPKLKLSKPHATMLVFFLSDVNISKNLMDKIMVESILPEFNSFSIDSDMSPNDTIFFCANGSVENRKIDCFGKDFDKFKFSINKISKEIVKKLLFDGEGVNRVVKLIVKNSDIFNAEKIVKTISSSLLVKTAINGADPNWGRILSACGRSEAKIELKKLDIYIGKYKVVKNGVNNFISDDLVRKEMLKKYYEITIDVKKNNACKEYIFYTTDLSKKYVDINSKYKT